MMKTFQLKKWIIVLGALNLSFLLMRVALSYCLVTIAPLGIAQPNETQFFGSVAESLAFLGAGFQNLLTGNSIFRQESAFAAACSIPFLLSTSVFILLLAVLTRYREEILPELPQTLFRWSVVFIIVGALAVPYIAQDFWLSIAWGRMTAGGFNPYHADLTAEFMTNLPLESYNQRMTYGPLWTLISGVVVFVSGGNGLVAAVLFKLLLVGAWISVLWLVWKMLEQHSPAHQCLGLAIFGWLPLTITEIAAEGHNDIVMVFLMMLWLYYLERNQALPACLALAASALVKYTTAPLFFLTILYFLYSRRKPLTSYILPLFAAGLLIIAVFALFYRSPDFFASTVHMRDWQFLTPTHVVKTFAPFLKLPSLVRYLPQLIFLAVSVYGIIAYIKSPNRETFRYAVLTVMSAILFCALGHVWAWFVVWIVPLAALMPDRALSRWGVGVALTIPLALMVLQFTYWSAFTIWELPGLFVYTFALLWIFIAPTVYKLHLPAQDNLETALTAE